MSAGGAGCLQYHGRLRRRALATIVVSMLAALSTHTSTEAAIVRDLPGLEGPSVEIIGASPGPGSETTIVANVAAKKGAAGSIKAIRLRSDGAPQIGFGRWGVATFSQAGRATSAATDPKTGRVYVSASVGGRPAMLALDENGYQDRSFGSGGVVRLPGSGPQLIAADAGYLFIASGTGDCAGCTIKELSLPSGALITSSTLSRDQLAGRTGCPRARIGGIAVLGSRLILTVEACGQLLIDIAQPHLSDSKTLRGSRIPLGSRSTQSRLGTDQAQRRACLATRQDAGTRLTSVSYPGLRTAADVGRQLPSSGSLLDLAPFGSSGCAALSSARRSAVVLLLSRSGSLSARRVPGLSRVEALAACGQGLLALGVSRSGGSDRARLVVVSSR